MHAAVGGAKGRPDGVHNALPLSAGRRYELERELEFAVKVGGESQVSDVPLRRRWRGIR